MFLPNAVELGQAKKEICRAHGFEGLYPLDDPEGRLASATDLGLAIFRHCVDAVRRADLLIANMTPFRGPSVDVGTALEMGMMYALGRPVFGYTNAADDYSTRVAPDGYLVEDFGFADNLMCEGAVRAGGGTVVRTAVPVAHASPLSDLVAFEACVRQAAGTVGSVRRRGGRRIRGARR